MKHKSIKTLSSSNRTASADIPKRLKTASGLRFVLVGKSQKRPLEKKWQQNNNYPADSKRLREHLKSGGNYGVVCGIGGLIVLDSDEEERLNELGVISELPKTFTVRTGGGGTHRYYICPDLDKRIVLFDPNLADEKGNYIHLGEIQSSGQQVVGPGSIHPNGNRYEVIDDTEIATVTRDQLLKAIIRLKASRKGRKSTKRRKGKHTKSSSIEIQIKDIAWPDGEVQKREGRNGTEYFGSNPVHGSTTGQNFHINVDKNVWHCHRCGTGGGPLEWIAVKCGIIRCDEAGPGCLRGEKYRQVLGKAREMGYDIPVRTRQRGQFEVIEERIKTDTLPDDLPPNGIVVVKGPPRIGKTYWSMRQLIKARSGIYITHNHSIGYHALQAFEKQGGISAVYLEGKSRPGMCRYQNRNCKDCELCPNQQDDNHINYTELEKRAKDLLLYHGILTKDQVPFELCPYYTLKLAEKSAKYCFTVPHFIEELEPRKIIVLDEDPTLSHFYPRSAELLRYKKEKNEYKFDNTLGKALEQSHAIRMLIEEKERKTKADRALLWSLDALANLNAIIINTMNGVITFEECMRKIEVQITLKSKITYDDVTIEKAISKLDEYKLDHSSEIDLKDYIRCWFKQYGKKPLFTLSAGRSGYKSVYLIGDATRPTIHMQWSDTARKQGRKILIIGNTLAELFGRVLGGAIVIEISNFKYAKNYVIVPIDSSGEDTYDGQIKNQRHKVIKLIKDVARGPDSRERHPILMLTGSKKNQDAAMRSLGGISHASQEEGEVGQQWNHRSGFVNVFYQNSTISRGLDVDQFHVMCVHDADFAQPFWAAALEAGEEDAQDILESIIMDETTNSVLRISPIVGRDELRPKVVIIPRSDLWKIRYLDEQMIGDSSGGRTPDIENIALLIRESNLAGTIRLTPEGTKIDDKPKGEEWKSAVENNTLMALFQIELDKVGSRDKYSKEELQDAMHRILDVLRKAKRKWLSINQMREMGLKCKDALIRPALTKLYYQGKVKDKWNGKTHLWVYHHV